VIARARWFGILFHAYKFIDRGYGSREYVVAAHVVPEQWRTNSFVWVKLLNLKL
jgi:hypothetical protein